MFRQAAVSFQDTGAVTCHFEAEISSPFPVRCYFAFHDALYKLVCSKPPSAPSLWSSAERVERVAGSGRLVSAVQRQYVKTVWEWARQYYGESRGVGSPACGRRAVRGGPCAVKWQPGGGEAAGGQKLGALWGPQALGPH